MTEMKIIARIRTELPEKFGVPRQSGLVPQLRGRVIFEPEYRNPDALRGLEDFSHIWLIWQFSRAVREGWSPTVRPPRLGGNRRMGVFATRSPFRPNALGLSSVRLDRVELDPALGPVLHVSGADLMDGTPIFDIKPYLPYTDSHPQAAGGFTDGLAHAPLTVECSPALLEHIPADSREGLLGVLDQALAAYNDMRAVEGRRLAEDIAGRLVTIETAVGRVERQSPQTVSAYRERLEKKMREVLASTTIDEGRILTEAAIFADKVAVDEETVRLRSHVAQLRTMLQAQRPTGKDMDFLMQEFNRECNTIGSKCNDLAVTQDVVAMKAEVEKIREQVQNIE